MFRETSYVFTITQKVAIFEKKQARKIVTERNVKEENEEVWNGKREVKFSLREVSFRNE